VNGRTPFSDAMTTALAATLLLSLTTGHPDEGPAPWAARFSVTLAASYLFWRHRYRNRSRLSRGATNTEAD